MFPFVILQKFRFDFLVQAPTSINGMSNIMAMLAFEVQSFAIVVFSLRERACMICMNIRIIRSRGMRHDLLTNFFMLDCGTHTLERWKISVHQNMASKVLIIRIEVGQ